jgi:hypothetical protein
VPFRSRIAGFPGIDGIRAHAVSFGPRCRRHIDHSGWDKLQPESLAIRADIGNRVKRVVQEQFVQGVGEMFPRSAEIRLTPNGNEPI